MGTHMEVSHGVQWTTERRAVGADRPASAASQAASAWGTTTGRRPQVFRRDPVDPVDGRAVEGVAAEVQQPDDMLATSARVGRERHVARALASVPGGVA